MERPFPGAKTGACNALKLCVATPAGPDLATHSAISCWSWHGANALLHVRCAVLDGIDMLNFLR